MIRESLNNKFLEQVIEEEILNSNIKIVDSNNNNYTNKFSSILAAHIDKKIKPDFDTDKFKPMHLLSHDEENDVLNLIRFIETQSEDQVRTCKDEIAKSLARAQKLRKKLEACEKNNDVLLDYLKKMDSLKDRIGKLMVEKGHIEAYVANLIQHSTELGFKIEKAEKSLIKARKNKSIFLLCKNAHIMLQSFIPKLVEKKLDSVKEKFMFIVKQLLAKQNYIQDIVIDNNFNVTLYRQSVTTIGLISNIISKIGFEAFTKQMGERCIKHLMNELGITRISDLEKAFAEIKNDRMIELPMKVDINGLSKGEQQIYIMSLYWALIKMSNNNIPFVIDTPYARIDSIHRERITTKFFPSLSSQVIILSTDEEINDEYYKLIKPFIAKEFLISYSDTAQCTLVEEKYFFEVAS